MKKIFILSLFVCLQFVFFSCSKNDNEQNTPIENEILYNDDSFFYIDFKNYPIKDKRLPIGIFDSGTGGLTVLDAMINSDNFNNESHQIEKQGDNKIDFLNESFIYLGDKANMPYGEYSGKNKTDLLKEHIIKDVQFLLGDKYYPSQNSEKYNTDKCPIKAIVIACNTATAYGKNDIESFIKKAGLDIKVIGVIGAGVRGALENITKTEDATFGIMATAGTVASNGYPNTVAEQKYKLDYFGGVITFQQAGIGLAAAIDGEKDYMDTSLNNIRENYRGPSFTNENALINKTILARYNFDFSNNQMLYSGNLDNPTELQINSIDNYIKYHVISLLEKIRNSETKIKLKSVILGCTHYPFFMDNFRKEFKSAYSYKENGEFVYRSFMAEEIALVDPAINTAKELYTYLNKNNLFNNGSIENSKFYISVPNLSNENNKLADPLNFTYDYKYGRNSGDIQEYIKNVPFSDCTISSDLMERLKEQIPFTYSLIKTYINSIK
ncbi:MAG: aspartate/glutamate racemase family protein [Bacteroidetes bacterium]|nr:aspartate/glutamate racemase family protein [Bacteroidota bacterium]MBU1117254.1 aspartate/glutamate racemase family protein [Bacteroidota bacterium]MBU1797403.1 aspartate/glutamate racemase family protein [Bacteroidota bacterium]